MLSENWLRDLEWNAVSYALVAAVAVAVIVALWLAIPAVRRRWLLMPRLRPGRWGGQEVLLAFCIFLAVPRLLVLAIQGAVRAADPEVEPNLARLDLLAAPLAFVVMLALLFWMTAAASKTFPCRYGLTRSRWPANVALGLAVFLAITPITLGLHAAATLVFGQRLHALTALGESNPAAWEWCLIAFRAVIAAPVLEEILFRGILQGWLRRASFVGHLTIALATMLAASLGSTSAADVGPLLFAAVLVAVYLYSIVRQLPRVEWVTVKMPAEPNELDEEKLHDEKQRWQAWREANAQIAVFGSAMLFAMFHAAVWPAPIALFVFGLVLGEVARRTQSLIGPITLHAAFNLVAFVALLGSTHQANGNTETTADRPAAVSAVPASQ